MPKTRDIWTNLSKGELGPRIQGRPDLVAYNEGGEEFSNFLLTRQGGGQRRSGTRFVSEVKDSTKDTILIPFEASVDDSYMLEFGHQYIRFFKNGAPILSGGIPLELVTPYTEADLRLIHFTQSVDVLFLFHRKYQQKMLTRITDTSWQLSDQVASPPPSFEADTDISAASATLTPAATTGTGVNFTASTGVFLAGDVGRIIIFGASRALITGFTSATVVVCSILSAFPNTSAIPAGQWLLKLSPQVTLDPNIKDPVGATVTLVAGANAFRAADVGKFITIYGGLIKILFVDAANSIRGEILSPLTDTSQADPAAAPAGSWTLEQASWSNTNGWPATGEFNNGRLVQAGTDAEPTTWWMSSSDSYDNYAIGSLADSAVRYTIASRQLNRIEYIADADDLFFGTTGNEQFARGGREGEPIGGDVIPLVKKATRKGNAPIQPVIIDSRIIFLDRSRKKLYALAFDVATDRHDAVELTAPSDHITGDGIRLGPLAYRNHPDPQLFMSRPDGQVAVLTYFPNQKVIGFTRIVTDGEIEAVGVKPHSQDTTLPDEVWMIVKRTINGVVKKYVEYISEHSPGFSRTWDSLQTDCSITYVGASTTTIMGLSHLEGKMVDVIVNGSFIGQKVVSGGAINLPEAATQVEVGLHYASKYVSMRPTIQGLVLEGIPRSWDTAWVRVYNAMGGRVNGEALEYPAGFLDTQTLFTGDLKVTSGLGWSTDGRFTVEQNEPYPFEFLALFGTLSIGEHD